MTDLILPRHVGAPPPPPYRVLLTDVPGPDDTRQDLTVEIAPPYFPDPAPLPAATLWATWQRHVARDPTLAAAWYQTLSAADQATLSALTLAQVAAALGRTP